MTRRAFRVAVVAPIVVRHDAISLAARDTVRALTDQRQFTARHFGCVCDYPEIDHIRCCEPGELLLNPWYQQADAAIFHFGIHHPLFNALLAGGPPVRVVCFHNVTPRDLVGSAERGMIERSEQQIHVLDGADEIWAVSDTNRNALAARGFPLDRIRVIPLVVEDPGLSRLSEKSQGSTDLLFVGRFAPSKGLDDLIAAFRIAHSANSELTLAIAGSTRWANPDYVEDLRRAINEKGLSGSARIIENPSDDERDRLYEQAHVVVIPSFHEGFCRPIIEGLRAGCLAVGYDGYNLPIAINGFGRVVRSGDVDALAEAMIDVARSIAAGRDDPHGDRLRLDRGNLSVRDFERAVAEYVDQFAFASVATRMRDRLTSLIEAERVASEDRTRRQSPS